MICFQVLKHRNNFESLVQSTVRRDAELSMGYAWGMDPKSTTRIPPSIFEYQVVRKKINRNSLHLVILACFACLIIGFVAGASYQYLNSPNATVTIESSPAREIKASTTKA